MRAGDLSSKPVWIGEVGFRDDNGNPVTPTQDQINSLLNDLFLKGYKGVLFWQDNKYQIDPKAIVPAAQPAGVSKAPRTAADQAYIDMKMAEIRLELNKTYQSLDRLQSLVIMAKTTEGRADIMAQVTASKKYAADLESKLAALEAQKAGVLEDIYAKAIASGQVKAIPVTSINDVKVISAEDFMPPSLYSLKKLIGSYREAS
jgi:hypothetical protein